MALLRVAVVITCAYLGFLSNLISSHPTTTDFPATETILDEFTFETTQINELRDSRADFVETTTNPAPPFEETTVIFQEPSKSQQDVVEELNGLWNISESLDENEEGQLKSSLNSILNLAYARVQVEPEETLDRLKNLLRALRSRLSRTADDGNKHNFNTNSYPERRRRRSIIKSKMHLHNLVTAASLMRLPEEQIASTLRTPQRKQNALSVNVPPGDATIQKVIHVGDRELVEIPLPPQAESQLQSEPSDSSASTTVIQTNVLLNNATGELPSAATAESIANAILKLLHQNTLENYGEVGAVHGENIEFGLDHNSENESAVAVSMPSIFDSSENEILDSSIQSSEDEPVHNVIITTSSTTPKWSQEEDSNSNEPDQFNVPEIAASEENTNSMGSPPKPVVSSPPIVHIFEELSTSNIMAAPMIFLNGTRDGMSQFIQTFSILSFKTKMAILFAISISVLSIAIGIFSLGPPIIAVGAFGILIPIVLLLALQSQDQTVFLKKRERIADKHSPLLSEMDKILDLIIEAVEKYKG